MSHSLRLQVELDLDQIARLRSEYGAHLALADMHEIPHELVVVLGTVLHSFYNGVENAIKRILIRTDEKVPSGESSHAELLKQAAIEQAHRPAIISAKLHGQLLPFMAYRHFFRHAYSFQMDWDRMQGLVQSFGATADAVDSELRLFLDWFEASELRER